MCLSGGTKTGGGAGTIYSWLALGKYSRSVERSVYIVDLFWWGVLLIISVVTWYTDVSGVPFSLCWNTDPRCGFLQFNVIEYHLRLMYCNLTGGELECGLSHRLRVASLSLLYRSEKIHHTPDSVGCNRKVDAYRMSQFQRSVVPRWMSDWNRLWMVRDLSASNLRLTVIFLAINCYLQCCSFTSFSFISGGSFVVWRLSSFVVVLYNFSLTCIAFLFLLH